MNNQSNLRFDLMCVLIEFFSIDRMMFLACVLKFGGCDIYFLNECFFFQIDLFRFLLNVWTNFRSIYFV